MARNYRSIIILDKVYKAFVHCDDFLHWAFRANLSAMFMLALEIKLEGALYLHNEGYKTDDDYGLPQPLNKPTHINKGPSVAEASFDSVGYQGSTIPASPSTLKRRPADSPLH